MVNEYKMMLEESEVEYNVLFVFCKIESQTCK